MKTIQLITHHGRPPRCVPGTAVVAGHVADIDRARVQTMCLQIADGENTLRSSKARRGRRRGAHQRAAPA